MSELEIFYSKEELEQMDRQIERQIDQHMEQEIQNCLLKQMQPLFGEVDYSLFADLSERAETMPEELLICELFSILKNQHKKTVTQLNLNLENKYTIINDLQAKEKTLNDQLTLMHKTNQQLQKVVLQTHKTIADQTHKLYIQNDKILNQEKQIMQLKALIEEKEQNFIQKQEESQSIAASLNVELDKLKNEMMAVVEERDSLKDIIWELQEDLNEQIERRSMNLVTFRIQSEEIALKHLQAIEMFRKADKIYGENRCIVSLLSEMPNKFITYNLVDLQIPLQKIETIHQTMGKEIASNQNKISKLKTICDQKINTYIETNKRLINQLSENMRIIKQNQQTEVKRRKQEQEMKQKTAVLQTTIHHLTESNYKILLDLQQSKAKIEESYLRECELTKSLSQQLDLMKELTNVSKNKLQALEIELRQEKQLNKEMERRIAQSHIKYKELQQIYSDLKSNLSEKLTIFKTDESSQLQLVEHLIEKNETLSKQLAATRVKLNTLDYEKQVSCELKDTMRKELIEKMETIDYTINTNNILKEENERYEATLKSIKNEQNALRMKLTQQEQIIVNLNSQLKIKEPAAEKMERQVQTESSTSVRQSQIRKQKVSTQLTNSELSHLSMSDEQDFKQKTSNHHKFKYRNNETNQIKPTPCNHLQKIAALNEIINYFMNYIKGYLGRAIRPNSWLSSQILKHGQEYECKLLEESNIQTKVRNIKKIEEICMKENVCNKLIQQFQTVMEYYFEDRSAVLREKSLNGTISKSKLNKTLNKCMPNERTVIYRVNK